MQKQTFAAQDATTDDFLSDMRFQRSQGTGYSCGYTSSWVTEVFYGLSTQFVRYRLGDIGNETDVNTKAGYFSASGDEVIDLFTRYAAFDDRVVFQLVHSPPIDHVMVIEQLPSQAGYRVYQSYNSAHSLYAWLSPQTANLSKLYDNGYIMSNPKWEPLFAASLQALFGPSVTLDNYMYIPDEASPLVPILKAFLNNFINANTKDSVLANFRRAKEQYGEGTIISKSDFFGTYLPKLSAISSFFKEAWGTSTPIPQNVSDYWLDLYGTTNLFIFAGAPTNLIPTLIGYTIPRYYLEALPVVVPDDFQCFLNRNLLAWSLLVPGRRDATSLDLEGFPDAPLHSSASHHTAGGFVGIIIAAALLMGVAVLAISKRINHVRMVKPTLIDLELSVASP
eukprot:GGOE01065183.1.p1 GENE.GGOE01065183.1~~GGOE01065183.1.p1  ORF type:complete len:454 (-),score=51.30 GGOE01065183.1:459-1640(-)